MTSPSRATLDEAHRGTPGVYHRNAEEWDRARSRSLGEAPWLDRLLAGVETGASVLDLGCGGGQPIAAQLVTRGLQVTGLDQSEPLIRRCRERMPSQRWVVADMRTAELDAGYAAVVGWDSFFHLSPPEQRELLPGLIEALRPGGRLLLTVGPRAGEVLGSVAGATVYHSSLAPGEYDERLRAAGADEISITFEHPQTAGRTVLLARRAVGESSLMAASTDVL